MPADLSVSSIGAPVIAVRGAEHLHGSDESSTSTAGHDALPPHPNPTFRLDPALNIVVLQLHDRAGNVVSSFPTEQQLNAYRHGDRQVPAMVGGTPAAPVAPSENQRAQYRMGQTA